MLRQKRNPLSRLVAKVTAVTVGMMAWPWWFAPTPAAAQARITQAAVLDFQVAKGLDPSLGRRAADAVALELTNTGDYEVHSRSEVEDAMKAVFGSVQRVLDKNEQLRLGRSDNLDVDRIVTGTVVGKKVSLNPPGAQIQLAVIQRSMKSGEAINGAMVVGEASRPGGVADPEVLVDEAINKAAAKAVRTMQAYVLPHGIVLVVSRNKRIVINQGATNGVVPGMRFAVTRDRFNRERERMETEKVGELVIDSVDPAQATGHATLTMKGIESSDKVHAIYQLPNVFRAGTTPLPQRPAEHATSGLWTKIGLPVLFAIGLGSLVSGNARGKVTESPRGTTAQTGAEPTTVLVRFRDPSDVGKTTIMAHLIFRSTSPGFSPALDNLIDVTVGSQNEYVDTTKLYDMAANIAIDEDTGKPDTVDVTPDYDVDPTSAPSYSGGFMLGHSLADEMDIEFRHDPLVPGTRYYYKVARLTVAAPPVQSTVSSSGGGGGGGTQQNQNLAYELYISEASPVAGGATPLAEATLQSPPNYADLAAGSDTIDLSNVTFKWAATQGANEYVVQVSDDIRFPTGHVWQSDTDEGVVIQTPAAAGTVLSRTFTTLDNRFPNATVLYWRVGARNTGDSLPPVDGYLFNAQPWSFAIMAGPPGPPSTVLQFRRARSVIQKPASGARPAPVPRKPKR